MKYNKIFFAAIFAAAGLLVGVGVAHAAAPTSTTATIQSSNSVALTVDIATTGTADYDTFVGSGTAIANAADKLKILYNGVASTSSTIRSGQLVASFPIAVGTATSTGVNLLILAGAVQDAAVAPNTLIIVAAANILDSAAPLMYTVTPANSAYMNNVTSTSPIAFVLSETLSGGVASSTIILTKAGGTDAGSPHTCTLVGTGLTAGSHTISLSDTTNGCAVDASTLVSGIVYTIKFSASDKNGNYYTVSVSGVTFDNVVPVFSAVTPATDAFFDHYTSSSDIGFTIGENVASGSILITRTSGHADATSPHTCAFIGAALVAATASSTFDMSDVSDGCTAAVSLQDGTVYTFVFSATDAAGNAATTVTRTGVTYSVLSAPTGLTAVPVSLNSSLLGWTTAVGTPTSYHIYHSTDDTTFVSIGTSATLTYTDTTLASSVRYYFRVAAVNANGEGPKSTSANAVTISAPGGGSSYVPPAEVLPTTPITPIVAAPVTPVTPVISVADPNVQGTYSPASAMEATPSLQIDLSVAASVAATVCTPETLIRSVSNSAVYYCGADGFRYVFANESVYFTWFQDFSDVKVLTDLQLASIPLGRKLITYRPGVKMVKIQTDPKVYAVARGGVLRWVKDEAAAKLLYGDNWNTKIDDVSDAFFTSYTVGAPVGE